MISIDSFAGPTRIFDGTMDGKLQVRSNGGVAMLDQLIAPAPAAGVAILVKNSDPSALQEIRTTAAIDGKLAAFRVLGPSQTGWFASDGTGYISLNMPDRTRFASDTVLYVDNGPLGNDANSGISPLVPFKTPQAALDHFFMHYDMAGFNFTLQLADSPNHYAGFSIRGAMTGHYGYPHAIIGVGATFNVAGNPTDPSKVVIDGSINGSAAVENLVGKSLHLWGLTVQSSASHAIAASLAGTELCIHNVDFGPTSGAHIYAGETATVVLEGEMHVRGDAGQFIYVNDNAVLISSGQSIHFHGARSFGFVVGAARNATADLNAVTWVLEPGATVTGQRWKTLLGGVIDPGGHVNPDTVIPGSIAGSNNYGGQTFWP